MAENSAIEWTDHTFNPWIGCTKVGPGCDHCYAEALSTARLGVPWGPGRERRLTKPSTWQQPRRWDRKAAAAGIRQRVFCASLADVFDKEARESWRAELFQLIRETPNLDWLLVTKRIGNAQRMAEAAGGWPENVWLGATIVSQVEADRDIPKLAAIDGPRFRFLSMEPLLGPVQLGEELLYAPCANSLDGLSMDPSTGAYECCSRCDWTGIGEELAIHWVIVGGESGTGARPIHPDWVRSLRDQCSSAQVAFLFKQWGEWLPWEPDADNHVGWHSQAGGWIDRHQLPDLDSGDAAARKWSDACLYDGNDNCVHELAGKKAAGRLLDGITHDGVPT